MARQPRLASHRNTHPRDTLRSRRQMFSLRVGEPLKIDAAKGKTADATEEKRIARGERK